MKIALPGICAGVSTLVGSVATVCFAGPENKYQARAPIAKIPSAGKSQDGVVVLVDGDLA